MIKINYFKSPNNHSNKIPFSNLFKNLIFPSFFPDFIATSSSRNNDASGLEEKEEEEEEEEAVVAVLMDVLFMVF